MSQAQLNAALDLDKNETQIATPAEDNIESEGDVLQAPPIPPKVQRNSASGMQYRSLDLDMYKREREHVMRNCNQWNRHYSTSGSHLRISEWNCCELQTDERSLL